MKLLPSSPWARLRSAALAATALGLLAVASLGGSSAAEPSAVPSAGAPSEVERTTTLIRTVSRNQGPAQVLGTLGLNPNEQKVVLPALKDQLSFRRIRPGDQVRLERRVSDGSIRALSWRQGPADEVVVRACTSGYCAEKRAVSLARENIRVQVVLKSSLFKAILDAGQDPSLAQAATDVLAWDVDFYQDTRPGDELQVFIERVTVDGRFLRYGDVIAAQYVGSATGRKRLFRYTDPDGHSAYFDDVGQSTQRGFLRAPVPLVHVTSRFGSRRHPVLGYLQKHQAVDYAAPQGTPVWAVGDGTVATAGWRGDCGNAVIIRHRSNLETVYCHLSKVNVRVGAHVSQREIIGRVGMTGMATGPHLHYAVRRGGAFVNPMQLIVPRGEPLRKDWMPDFLGKTVAFRSALDETPVAALERVRTDAL